MGRGVMTYYRKKPVVIEAKLVTSENIELVAYWCDGQRLAKKPRIEIDTLEGVMTAHIGDYVIKGVAGEFYPCKPEIFAQTYELAS